MAEAVRLQKFLSQAGAASRRRAEDLIRGGRVRVNGVVVAELGSRVNPATDVVEVDGRRVRAAQRLWIAFHKPRGVVSTKRDPQGRRTIYDVLPPRFGKLFYVGRLDRDSEGLMLLTNDGDGAHRLLHPRYGAVREYEVDVEGTLSASERERLVGGIELEDGRARAEEVRVLGRPGPGRTRLRLTLREGRKREVRRMLEAVGRRVERLVRVRYGPVELGDLAPGEWRRLGAREIGRIESTGDAPT
jgi:pseudouridine synthase